MTQLPDWWQWELEISSHCLKRMKERGFSESDLRAMIEDTIDIQEQDHGSFVVKTRHDGGRWEVIVSPDETKEVIIVVTAYLDP